MDACEIFTAFIGQFFSNSTILGRPVNPCTQRFTFEPGHNKTITQPVFILKNIVNLRHRHRGSVRALHQQGFDIEPRMAW